MNERPVRGIHQADDSVIDGAGQIGGEVGDFVLLTEGGDARRRHGRIVSFGESGSRRRGVGDENPDETVLFFAGIAASVDAIYF